MKNIIFLTILLLFPLISFSNTDLKFDKSLEELFNIKVNVVSVNEEKLLYTPGIVTRYNRYELEQLGVKSLNDMIALVPGVVINQGSIGTNPIMIRGISDGFNQKVLFLLNDVPLFMPTHSDIPNHSVPYNLIEYIEVIRGPGSVLYGTNATAGLIKVYTKTDEDKNISVTAGSNHYGNISTYFGKNLTNHQELYFAAEVQDHAGASGETRGHRSAPSTFPSNLDTKKNMKFRNKHKAVFMQYKFLDLNFTTHIFESKNSGFASNETIINDSEWIKKGQLYHLEYNSTQLKKMNINAYADYNNFYHELEVKNDIDGINDALFLMSSNGKKNVRSRLGVKLNFNFNKTLNIFSGVEFEKRAWGNYKKINPLTKELQFSVVPAQRTYERSAFVDVDANFEKFRFILGGRAINNSKGRTGYTHRQGIVFKLDSKQSLKLISSTGFNSPNAIQTDIQVGAAVAGSKDLRPESNQNIDLAYTWNVKNTLFVANFFYLKAKNFINRESSPGGAAAFTFFNSSNFKRRGLELDYQKTFGQFKIITNMAYHKEGHEIIAKDPNAYFTPKLTMVLGSSYILSHRQSIGSWYQYISPRSKVKAHHNLNINYQLKLSDVTAFITVKNLIGKKKRDPDLLNFNTDRKLPASGKQSFLLGAKLSY